MNETRKKQIEEQISSAALIEDGPERGRKYRNIIGVLCLEFVRSNDRWFLDEAIKTAGLVTDDPSKAYLEIAKTMVKNGIAKNDDAMIEEALEITENIKDEIDLSVALHEVAQAFAFVGINRKDEALISRSLNVTDRILRDSYRSSAFRQISRALLKSNSEKARRLLENSIGIIEGKKIEPIFLISAFLEISFLLAVLNDDRSRDFLGKAIALVDEIKDEYDRSAILLKTVETEIMLAKIKNDNVMIREASILSEKISREYYRTLAANALKARA